MHKSTIAYEDINEQLPTEITLSHKRFKNCSIGLQCRRPENRLIVRKAVISDCEATSCHVGPVLFIDCAFKNIRSPSPLWLRGAAFVNCTFEGIIDGILSFELVEVTSKLEDPINHAMYLSNQEIYKQTECAVDLTKADCLSVSFRGIPPHLVRAASPNHFKVSYQNALVAINQLKEGSDLRGYLEDILFSHSTTQSDFTIFTSPNKKGNDGRWYARDQELFAFLRENGASA